MLLKFSGLIASSWALSWCLYRLHGIRLIGPPREEIWYFAYGCPCRKLNPSILMMQSTENWRRTNGSDELFGA